MSNIIGIGFRLIFGRASLKGFAYFTIFIAIGAGIIKLILYIKDKSSANKVKTDVSKQTINVI